MENLGFHRLSLIGGNRHKIIVGIDYGTTFSGLKLILISSCPSDIQLGISYVTTDKSDIDDINIITTWPGHQSTTWKTPTRLAYKRENTGLHSNKWGFEVDSKLKSYSWTKLLLDKNAPVGDYDEPSLSTTSGQGMMRVPSFRDAQGVCEDFLREMHLCIGKVATANDCGDI